MRTRGRNKARHMCTEISDQIRCVRHAARQVSKRQRKKINLKQGMRWRWHRDASEGQKGYLRRSDRDVHSDLALIAPQVPIQSPPSRYQQWAFSGTRTLTKRYSCLHRRRSIPCLHHSCKVGPTSRSPSCIFCYLVLLYITWSTQ